MWDRDTTTWPMLGLRMEEIVSRYEGVFKSFRTESITKYKLTFGIIR